MASGQNGKDTRTDRRRTDAVPAVAAAAALHRLGEVRKQEGISRRTIARYLGITTAEVALQERETTDLPLSTLYKWQRALNVPLVELLVEPGETLSPPLMKRARLVQIMKTAASIMEHAKLTSVKRLAETMIQQLIEIMPELRETSAWPAVGQRRQSDEYGRAAERSFPEDVFGQLPRDLRSGEWT